MEERVRPTIHHVATRAGVSPATVSRVLTQPSLVRPEKRARVSDAIRALGYVRDGTARALVSGSTGAVGVVVPTLDAAIFSRAVQSLQSRLAEAGYRLIVASHEYSASTEVAAARSLIEHGIDAIVLVGMDHANDLWSLVDATPIPLVLTWSMTTGRDCVGFDNRRAGRIAAEHLLSLGHRTFGIVSGITEHNDRAIARINGVREALAEAGLGIPERRITQQPFSLAGGRAGLVELLRDGGPPTAVIGGNDLLAAGVLFEAQARGIPVPGRLSIVGIDNLELSAHVTPALTTVHLPTADLGRRTAELVLQRLEERDSQAPQSIELPIALVQRGSTGPVAAAIHRVAGRRRQRRA